MMENVMRNWREQLNDNRHARATTLEQRLIAQHLADSAHPVQGAQNDKPPVYKPTKVRATLKPATEHRPAVSFVVGPGVVAVDGETYTVDLWTARDLAARGFVEILQ
jgi:hypothetical protein